MRKKQYAVIISVIGFAVVIAFLFINRYLSERKTEQQFLSEVFYTRQYYVADEKTARKILRLQGELLRSQCEENEVREIERELEKAYGIEAVNLQDVDAETADAIRTACLYMFTKYPVLHSYLTNITVQDDISERSDAIAKYENFMFLTNPDETELYPFVIKNQILLRRREFANRERLENLIKRNIDNGFWSEGTSIESIMVHELSHALVDCIISSQYGLGNSIYITESNADAFSQCNMQDLASNQEFAQSLCRKAYAQYCKDYSNEDSYEEFCMQISGYGVALQEDGGIAYEETIAEAVADVYLHGEDAGIPSKLISSELDKAIEAQQTTY
ncbi:MAG: hypothetical protein IJ711_05490 [Lachnospiraceae bacterium]|nr:hypothetical protein [Lachnospiraceae bacterium]